MGSRELEACFSCGGDFTPVEGPVQPTHRYMKSTPGCWAAFGVVLAREFGNAERFAVHRLTVDSYAVQHPGGDDRQSIHSGALHLVRLCLFFEHDLATEHADRAMRDAARDKQRFVRLAAPANLGETTVADVLRAGSDAEHRRIVRRWARQAWEAWSTHHGQIREWLPPWAVGG